MYVGIKELREQIRRKGKFERKIPEFFLPGILGFEILLRERLRLLTIQVPTTLFFFN